MAKRVMVVNEADWQYASGRDVQAQGHWYVWRCPYHNDGSSPDRWSCKGKGDGYFRCFTCKAAGSIVDLLAYTAHGTSKTTQRSDDVDTRRAYRDAFTELTRRGVFLDGNTETTTPTLRIARCFTGAEQAYLRDAFTIFQHDLQQDDEAQRYLAFRGTTPLPIFGVARPHRWRDLCQLARRHGDPDLVLSSGLGMVSKKDIGERFQLVSQMIVTAQLVDDRLRYYQARRIRPREGRRNYYNPIGIKKVPITYALESPLRWSGEGVYKGAWLWARGWGGGSLTDSEIAQWSVQDLAFVHGSFWFQDVEPPEKYQLGVAPGLLATRQLAWKVRDFGGSFRSVKPPKGYKDIDEWARAIGWDKAERILRKQYLARDE